MIFSFYIKIIHNVIKNHKISYTITPKTVYFKTFNAEKREKRYNYKKKILILHSIQILYKIMNLSLTY